VHWTPTPFDMLNYATDDEIDEYRENVTPEAEALFAVITRDLPLLEMYGLGPHSLAIIQDVIEIVRPAHIFEIGFGAGASASMFLGLRPEVKRVLSVDWTTNDHVIQAARSMERRYAPRFRFVSRDSGTLTAQEVMEGLNYASPDLVFIDGDHEHDAVARDILLAKSLATRWILLDDWWPKFGPGVQSAWSQEGRGYALHSQWGNVILFRKADVKPENP